MTKKKGVSSNSDVDMRSVYQNEPRDAFPLAGAVFTPENKERKWKYIPMSQGGQTEKNLGEMKAPTSDDDEANYTRAHELTHAAQRIGSPNKKPAWKDHGQAFEFIEEARVGRLLLDLKPHPSVIRGEAQAHDQFVNLFTSKERLAEFDDRERAMLALVAAREEDVDSFKISSKPGRELIHRIFREHINNPASNRDSSNNTKYVEEFDRIWELPPEPPPCGGGEGHGDGKCNGHDMMPNHGKNAKEGEGKPDDRVGDHWVWQDENTKGKPRSKFIFNKGDTVWGEMAVEHPPLVRPSKAARNTTKKPRRTDMGHIIKWPQRVVTDGMIYKLKKRQKKVPGGTILLDGSGSMSLSYEQIEELLQAAPAAEIAMYAGESAHGFTRIIAKDGMMCTKDHYRRPSNNLVDGPALKWLATRPGPRYWISDEGVTGLGANQPGSLVRECRDTCKKFAITRIETIEIALDMLNKQAAAIAPKVTFGPQK